jgi:hypothetical protein
MKRSIINFVIIVIVLLVTKYGYSASLWTIIDDLKSTDTSRVEKTCKSLGLERGALGLSTVRFLEPWYGKSTQTLSIISVSWEGPFDGYLILIDSSEKVLQRLRTGYVKSIELRPLRKDGNDILIVDTIKGTGTGYRQDQLKIIKITRNGFVDIWNGISFEKSFPLQIADDQNYEIKGSINFDDLNNDGVQEMLYTITQTHFFFDPQNHKLSQGKTEKIKKVYRLVNDKYVPMEAIQNKENNNGGDIP